MFETISDLANDLHFSFFPKYKCIDKFREVPKDSIVHVEIDGDIVYIYHNKHISCTNIFILDMHFIKETE